ncbi:DUF1989 domain-containing protein [Nguyenibacter vanlangensis]|uniref:DUF1989 domain-containing protein n=1 Tax=Nguyenibacter vanlangensis TaxID=1216886 RepID=A0A7Y7M3N8_9PROT|nr:aminomethyltransferase family protein [Nguyenibacter vanlangensis]NVN09895.1 DUF1989 domain-containing protein [Nguyenibacter vanlangensis]
MDRNDLVGRNVRSCNLVAGGSARFLSVRAGDIVRLVGPDGGQPVVLLAPAGMIASTSVPDGMVLHAAEIAAVWDREAGGAFETFVPFDRDTPAGMSADVAIGRDGRVLVAAPGAAMAPSEQNPPTAITVELHVAPDEGDRLPDPLAPPVQDLHVPAASARAYRVKKGDYIQIIDISGRQCSDFLAFDAGALAEGREYGLDATATRTAMGHAMPMPGLHAKFFDVRNHALVEIIQDTVGRHDAFLTACSAKYYDDAGYPGHDNCSDNFNRELGPFGVAARAAWPAINFFYNTAVLPCGTITMDEPWSRPGDYVLLQAKTDLICASSSCADDIDAANAWHPTDIQVRIYDGHHHFPRATARRMTPDSPPVMTRDSGFHHAAAARGARFVEYKGFWLPESYTGYGPIAEYWACRRVACVMDLSALRKFEILGPDAEELLQYAVTRDIRKLAVGQVVYTALCYPHGGMLDDGTIFRMGPQAFRLVCGDEYCGPWLRALATERGLAVSIRASTDQLHNIALQGPLSRDILAPLVFTPAAQPTVAALKWFRFTIGRLGGEHGIPVVISRTGYTGELGFEIWCHPATAGAVWDIVWTAGQPHGLAPLGLTALDMVRIEAGLIFADYEFCAETDPFEAGIGFAVPASKTDDFVGAAALATRRAHPLRRLVGLDVASNDTVSHGDPVYQGRAQVGVVTSATRSPVLGCSIALARIDASLSAPGTGLEIGKLDGQQKRLVAQVARFPAYDPEKARVRA